MKGIGKYFWWTTLGIDEAPTFKRMEPSTSHTNEMGRHRGSALYNRKSDVHGGATRRTQGQIGTDHDTGCFGAVPDQSGQSGLQGRQTQTVVCVGFCLCKDTAGIKVCCLCYGFVCPPHRLLSSQPYPCRLTLCWMCWCRLCTNASLQLMIWSTIRTGAWNSWASDTASR